MIKEDKEKIKEILNAYSLRSLVDINKDDTLDKIVCHYRNIADFIYDFPKQHEFDNNTNRCLRTGAKLLLSLVECEQVNIIQLIAKIDYYDYNMLGNHLAVAVEAITRVDYVNVALSLICFLYYSDCQFLKRLENELLKKEIINSLEICEPQHDGEEAQYTSVQINALEIDRIEYNNALMEEFFSVSIEETKYFLRKSEYGSFDRFLNFLSACRKEGYTKYITTIQKIEGKK